MVINLKLHLTNEDNILYFKHNKQLHKIRKQLEDLSKKILLLKNLSIKNIKTDLFPSSFFEL